MRKWEFFEVGSRNAEVGSGEKIEVEKLRRWGGEKKQKLRRWAAEKMGR